MGCVHIFINPLFKVCVKNSHADNVDSRLRYLNNSECIPLAFCIYAIYEIEERLTDLKFNSLIDKLNSIGYIDCNKDGRVSMAINMIGVLKRIIVFDK